MTGDRTELERLDRDTLIAHAERSGVVRARILTRPELIDELLSRAVTTRPDDIARVRGFFGRARDLLARVVERGLHLPDAAERLRGRSSPPPPVRQGAPLPTVTLAEIYAAQGHRERAVDTLKNVLDREPEHIAARKLIERLQDAAYSGPEPPALPPEDEIFSSRPPSEPPARIPATLRNVPEASEASQVQETGAAREATDASEASETSEPSETTDDECVAIPVNRETIFVHWDVSARTRKHLERARPGGTLALRVLVISPTWDGPESSVQDLDVQDARGDSVLRGLPERAVVRAAIGWLVGGELVPIAHSPALEAFESDEEGAVSTVARWTPRGVTAVDPDDRDAGAIERAFGAIRERARARESLATQAPRA